MFVYVWVCIYITDTQQFVSSVKDLILALAFSKSLHKYQFSSILDVKQLVTTMAIYYSHIYLRISKSTYLKWEAVEG